MMSCTHLHMNKIAEAIKKRQSSAARPLSFLPLAHSNPTVPAVVSLVCALRRQKISHAWGSIVIRPIWMRRATSANANVRGSGSTFGTKAFSKYLGVNCFPLIIQKRSCVCCSWLSGNNLIQGGALKKLNC